MFYSVSYDKNLKLNTKVHFTSEHGFELTFPTEFEFIDYYCMYFENTKIGLRYFFLMKNPINYNEEAVRKVNRIPFSIFNEIDAGAGYLEHMLSRGVNPNNGIYDIIFT